MPKMAANEYYNSNQSNHSSPRRRPEAALPPLPVPVSSYSAYRPEQMSNTDSPVTPIYDGPTTSLYGHQSRHSLGGDSRYYGAGESGMGGEHGAYADNIHLRTNPQKSSTDVEISAQPAYSQDTGLPGPASQLPQRTRRKRRGNITWVVYTLTLIQVVVFIAELVKNGKLLCLLDDHITHDSIGILTKSPIEIHPQVNPMLGPSIYVLINMGARYVPCMKNVAGIQDSAQMISWPCPNTTSSDVNSPMNQCQLSDLCGFSPVPNPLPNGSLTQMPQPNQWFRFIIPMFLHAGIIHISFNMLLQLTLGREIEQIIGPVRFLLVYLCSGIFGFVMGGNFAPSGIASTGASGALFGIIAVSLLDLLYAWNERKSPWKELAFIALDIVISFVLGLLPGLDNFSHIGGFLMGLVLGICLLRSPNLLRQRVGLDDPPYAPVSTSKNRTMQDLGGVKGLAKNPMGFFKGRKPLWWAWWLVRVVALVVVLICFILLLNNFYKDHKTCKWCKYLSCLVSFDSEFALHKYRLIPK